MTDSIRTERATAAFLVSGAGDESEAMVRGFALASWIAVAVLGAAVAACVFLVDAPAEPDSERQASDPGSVL